MSIKEMDSVRHDLPWTSGQKQILKSNGCKPKIYIDSCHTHSFFEVLQCLRNEEVLCDIKLETDDGVIVCAHRVVLVAACPYFRAMFISFEEKNKDVVHLSGLDSKVLRLLIDYMYSGKIMVDEQNAMDLLPAATLLQFDYVRDVCVDILKIQLNASNCLRIKEIANLYDCTELLSSSEEYIKTHFLKVIEAKEFLSLRSEEVINLISRDDINVPFEEKIFECVINWIKHELDSRHDSLPKLMEHVRLSLASQEYIAINVADEPLIKNNPNCKDFVIEALKFHVLKKNPQITMPRTIRNSPRQTGPKFLFSTCDITSNCEWYTSWYDPSTKQLHKTIEIGTWLGVGCGLALIKEHLVFALGNKFIDPRSFKMLDLSSHTLQWKSTVNMLVDRTLFGFGVLDDRIYAIGGADGIIELSCAEVFDVNVQEWRLISRMSTARVDPGVGTLNNLLYVVGGRNSDLSSLKSVECYDPALDMWIPVTQMSTARRGPGVCTLDGKMYAIGGDCQEYGTSMILKSVEAYSPITNVWSRIADMHLCRFNPSVVTFNGFLYVICGFDGHTFLDSIEIYNPETNIWIMESLPKSSASIFGAVVVDMPSHMRTV